MPLSLIPSKLALFGIVGLACTPSAYASALEFAPSGAHPAPQVVPMPDTQDLDTNDPLVDVLAKDPDDPIVRAYAQQQKIRHEKERELKIIRAKFFRDSRNVETRQIGMVKLREYTDPAMFPSMLEIFANEDNDVRGAILDHLFDQRTDDADTTLAWIACFDHDAWMRDQAGDRLLKRVLDHSQSNTASGSSTKDTANPQPITSAAGAAELPEGVASVIAHALRSRDDIAATQASSLCLKLNLIQAIPAMIQAQVLPKPDAPNQGTGVRDDSALAYILVGQQQAFVSDLTPVVGDSAVGFDPTLNVVTEGVVLRVIDAVVFTYRVEIHHDLVALSTRAIGGKSTAHLGYDQKAWARWYKEEFLPHQATSATTK